MVTSRSLTLSCRRHSVGLPSSSDRSLETFPRERSFDIVRRPGGLITHVPLRLNPAPPMRGSPGGLTRLLFNVTIERSLGPVHVIMSTENMIRDLIKAALEIYIRDKRRSLLPVTDPRLFKLHYSQFSLEIFPNMPPTFSSSSPSSLHPFHFQREREESHFRTLTDNNLFRWAFQ